MLTISPIRTISYYTDLAAEDYYLGSGEPPGEWYGLGCRQLKLYGETVEKESLEALINGGAPSGAPLVQNAYSDKRRLGWDCTFSAPKPVSVMWARAEEDLRAKIQEAQTTAAKRGIDALERYAAFTRRGKGGETLERIAGLVAATFNHCTSREQDPQLHTHAVICNVAPREDDSWGSVESRKLYQWQKAAGAIYRAELAAQMKELGFQVEREEDSFHVSGVDKEVCEYFSKRSKAIREELKKQGVGSSASKAGDLIKLGTRKDKGLVDHKVLLENWQKKMDEVGFSKECLGFMLMKEKVSFNELNEDRSLVAITDKKAIFKAQDLFYQIAIDSVDVGVNASRVESVTKQLLKDSEVVELPAESAFEPKYTTESVLACERMMIQSAKTLASRTTKQISDSQIASAIASAEDQLGFAFDDEQLEATYSMLSGGDFSIIQGSAGAGKTTAMLAANHAFQNNGYRVQGASIAKRAADNLQQETGIESVTIASLTSKIIEGANPLSNLDVLVIDEAGQLPSTDLQKLTHCAEQANCKIVLTGEDKQLDAINRGGALKYLSKPEVVGTTRIETIKRQRSEWARQVVADLRDGRMEKAFSTLDEKGCLHFCEDREKAKHMLVKDWHNFQKIHPNKKSLVIAQKWSDVQELSKLIRDIHISEGRVGQENIELDCCVAGKTFKTEFSKGDRIKFCRNDYRDLKVSNGTLGTITKIRISQDLDSELTVMADDGRLLSFLATNYSDNKGVYLCHAYALTVYSSQGVTVDGDSFYLHEGAASKSNVYVAMSRSKDLSHCYFENSDMQRNLCISDSEIHRKFAIEYTL